MDALCEVTSASFGKLCNGGDKSARAAGLEQPLRQGQV